MPPSAPAPPPAPEPLPDASPPPSLVRFAAPLVVSFLMRSAFTLVDTVFAAKAVGDAGVAALGLTVPFEFVMLACWGGLSNGLTSALSQAMGAREGEKIDQLIRVSWRLVLCVIPLFCALGAGIWFLAPHLGLAPDVARELRIFGSVLVGGSSLTVFWSLVPDSIVKAHHDTRSTMWAGISSNLLNVALNCVFTFALEWGMFGIALSTVLGRLGGLLYALRISARHEARRKALGSDTVPGLDPAPYARILGLAVPAALGFVLMASESAIVNGVLHQVAMAADPSGRAAKEALAGFAIYHRVALFALQPVVAMAVAFLPYAARLFGQKNPQAVRRALHEGWRAAALYGVVFLGPALLLLGPEIAARLAETPGTAATAGFALRLVPLGVILGAPFLLCRPVFEARGRGAPGLTVSLVRYALLTAPAAWLGAKAALALGRPAVHGVVPGLILAGALSAAGFYLWVRRALAREMSSSQQSY